MTRLGVAVHTRRLRWGSDPHEAAWDSQVLLLSRLQDLKFADASYTAPEILMGIGYDTKVRREGREGHGHVGGLNQGGGWRVEGGEGAAAPVGLVGTTGRIKWMMRRGDGM